MHAHKIKLDHGYVPLPDPRFTATNSALIVTGDMHAAADKLMLIFLYHEFYSLPQPRDYGAFTRIWNIPVEDMLKDLNATRIFIQKSDQIIESMLPVESAASSTLVLLGDLVCDRKPNSYPIYRLIQKYTEDVEHVLVIIFSNHDLEEMLWWEDIDEWKEYAKSGVNIFRTSYLSSESRDCYRSLTGLQLLILNGLVDVDEMYNIYQKCYLPHLKIIHYHKSESGLTIFTHALAGRQSIKELVDDINKYMEILKKENKMSEKEIKTLFCNLDHLEYKDQTDEELMETIDLINKIVLNIIFAKKLRAFLQVGKKTLLDLAWNRKTDEYELVNSPQLKKEEIYVKCRTQKGLEYKLLKNDKVISGFLKWSNLPPSFPRKDAELMQHKEECLPVILSALAQKGFVKFLGRVKNEGYICGHNTQSFKNPLALSMDNICLQSLMYSHYANANRDFDNEKYSFLYTNTTRKLNLRWKFTHAELKENILELVPEIDKTILFSQRRTLDFYESIYQILLILKTCQLNTEANLLMLLKKSTADLIVIYKILNESRHHEITNNLLDELFQCDKNKLHGLYKLNYLKNYIYALDATIDQKNIPDENYDSFDVLMKRCEALNLIDRTVYLNILNNLKRMPEVRYVFEIFIVMKMHNVYLNEFLHNAELIGNICKLWEFCEQNMQAENHPYIYCAAILNPKKALDVVRMIDRDTDTNLVKSEILKLIILMENILLLTQTISTYHFLEEIYELDSNTESEKADKDFLLAKALSHNSPEFLAAQNSMLISCMNFLEAGDIEEEIIMLLLQKKNLNKAIHVYQALSQHNLVEEGFRYICCISLEPLIIIELIDIYQKFIKMKGAEISHFNFNQMIYLIIDLSAAYLLNENFLAFFKDYGTFHQDQDKLLLVISGLLNSRLLTPNNLDFLLECKMLSADDIDVNFREKFSVPEHETDSASEDSTTDSSDLYKPSVVENSGSTLGATNIRDRLFSKVISDSNNTGPGQTQNDDSKEAVQKNNEDEKRDNKL